MNDGNAMSTEDACLRLNRKIFLQTKFCRELSSGRVFQIDFCIWELGGEENGREERKRK